MKWGTIVGLITLGLQLLCPTLYIATLEAAPKQSGGQNYKNIGLAVLPVFLAI